MSAIYVAASLPLKTQAQELAAVLRSAGHDVVSTWHEQDDATVDAERRLSFAELRAVGRSCMREIAECDALVIVVGPKSLRRGSWIEARSAMDAEKLVIAYELTTSDAEWCAMSAASVHERVCDAGELLEAIARNVGVGAT